EGVWLLERLGLAATLESPASTACRGILSYWDGAGPEFTDLGLPGLCSGRIVDRRQVDQNLLNLAAAAGVDVRRPGRLKFLGRRGDNPVRLLLEPSEGEAAFEVTASFVVEATGRGPVAGVVSDIGSRRLYIDRLVAFAVPIAAALQNDGLLRVAPSS